MTRLIVSREAETDLDEVLDYLEQEAGARTVLSYAKRFRKTLLSLAEFPGAGTLRPALGRKARISIVYPYVLIYDYDDGGDTLVLLRILHGRRNITKRLVLRARSRIQKG